MNAREMSQGHASLNQSLHVCARPYKHAPPTMKKRPAARRVMGGWTAAACSVWIALMLMAATASCWNASVRRPMPCRQEFEYLKPSMCINVHKG